MIKINYVDDKGFSIFVNPSIKLDLTEPIVLNDFINKNIKEGTKYLIIEDDIPDYNFQHAYFGDFTLNNASLSGLIFNVEIGKTILLNMMRRQRAPLFNELDLAYVRATETQDTQKIQEIVNKKNALRNVTEADLNSATDLESLKLLWPSDILGDYPY